MTSEQYEKAIARLHLSQVGAARFLQVDDSTCRRWISGKHDVPRAVALLLWTMIKYKITPADINNIRGQK